MYSQGESFYYAIDDDEYEFHVHDNIAYEDKYYIIAEAGDGDFYVFSYDEDEEEIERVEDENEAAEVMIYWQEEYDSDNDILDFDDDDEYYDKDDKTIDIIDDLYEADDKDYF
jgi:hypothetical protein